MLAEERTTEKDKKRIYEGKKQMIILLEIDIVVKWYFESNKIFDYTHPLQFTVRRVAAEGKRKVRTEEEELASKQYLNCNN